MRVRTLLAIALLGLMLVGCGRGAAKTAFVVERADGTPVTASLVRAVPLKVSPIPLPVSAEALEQLDYQRGPVAPTDDEGVVHLSLVSGIVYELEVERGAFDTGNGATIADRYRYDTGSREIEPVRTDGGPGYRVRLRGR